MTLLSLGPFLGIAGLFVALVAVRIAREHGHPHRWGSAAFWAILAVIMVGGGLMPPVAVGYLLFTMVVLAAAKQVDAPRFRVISADVLEASAQRLGNRLLHPVLLVPFVAIAGGLTLDHVFRGDVRLVDPKQVSQVALGLGCLAGLLAAFRLTRERPEAAVAEGGRLLEVIGWTLILPQMLAALGGIFAKAGVGDEVARIVASVLPVQNPFVAVLAYCAGMALFTIMMGNAFAAFPVITIGIGIPFIVRMHGGSPAVMGALGMLSGYCGTLVTPMAANFNIVPVRLLELRDDNAVIRAQVPFALAIWVFNVIVMYACVYR